MASWSSGGAEIGRSMGSMSLMAPRCSSAGTTSPLMMWCMPSGVSCGEPQRGNGGGLPTPVMDCGVSLADRRLLPFKRRQPRVLLERRSRAWSFGWVNPCSADLEARLNLESEQVGSVRVKHMWRRERTIRKIDGRTA